MRALVTGAEGFVGSHLVPRLTREGYTVTAHDRDLDVTDATAVAERIARLQPQLVVHLAAVSQVPESLREPELTYAVNFLGTRNLLRAVADHAPDARVLQIGTGDAYGTAAPDAPPFDERAPFRPRSPYARTKAAADRLGAEFAARGLAVVRVRPFNHTGPGQSDAFVLSSFARQVAEIAAGAREPELRVGNLDSVRDFLDVADVVDAYVALASPDAPPDAYNVASGRGLRIGDALERMLEFGGVTANVRVAPERFRPTDRSVGDAKRLRTATGWAPAVALSDTFERMVSFWREQIPVA